MIMYNFIGIFCKRNVYQNIIQIYYKKYGKFSDVQIIGRQNSDIVENKEQKCTTTNNF